MLPFFTSLMHSEFLKLGDHAVGHLFQAGSKVVLFLETLLSCRCQRGSNGKIIAHAEREIRRGMEFIHYTWVSTIFDRICEDIFFERIFQTYPDLPMRSCPLFSTARLMDAILQSVLIAISFLLFSFVSLETSGYRLRRSFPCPGNPFWSDNILVSKTPV
jgi:hypothetical protein